MSNYEIGVSMIKVIGVFGILLSTIPLKNIFSYLMKEEIKNIKNPLILFIYILVEFVIGLPIAVTPLYIAWILEHPIWGMLKLYFILSVLPSLCVTIIRMATMKKHWKNNERN
jgi:hypothetical protein